MKLHYISQISLSCGSTCSSWPHPHKSKYYDVTFHNSHTVGESSLYLIKANTENHNQREIMGIVEDAHNVKVLGTGNRFIVLAHGFGTDQSVWKHFVPHLVDDFRVVIYDNMGAGTTNPEYFDSERHSSLEGYAYDLLAILEELRVDSCIFVGHSVSAMIGAIASISRPDLFLKLIMVSASPRYLNDVNYFGGFEQDDLNQLFTAMSENYKAWCYGFAPLAVGGDMDSVAVQEFSRTLFNMRPDIALIVSRTIFQSDMRQILKLVTVPCHIIQAEKDMAVPVMVSEYLHQQLGGESIVEVMGTDGHLPQLSSPDIVIPVLLKHIQLNIEPKSCQRNYHTFQNPEASSTKTEASSLMKLEADL